MSYMEANIRMTNYTHKILRDIDKILKDQNRDFAEDIYKIQTCMDDALMIFEKEIRPRTDIGLPEFEKCISNVLTYLERLNINNPDTIMDVFRNLRNAMGDLVSTHSGINSSLCQNTHFRDDDIEKIDL